MSEYNVVNGTSYHAETPAAVIEVLERARQNRTRLHVSYGDAATGKDWLEEWDIAGIRDGQLHAAFESVEKARRWVHKLGVVAPISG